MSLAPEEDLFLFADERPAEAVPHGAWKLLIVDDEPEVHAVTRLALHDVVFAGRSLELLSAHSAQEARELIEERGDIAVILLDVVMETDNAGLDLVRYIRETLGNTRTRIILRTGQPGHAPERDVIIRYDINDYREKTDLTSSHLFTAIYGALRAYRDISTLESYQSGLEEVIDAAAELFECNSVSSFTKTTEKCLYQLLERTSAGGIDNLDLLWLRCSGGEKIEPVLATANLRPLSACRQMTDLPERLHGRIARILKRRVIIENAWIGAVYRETPNVENLFYADGLHTLPPTDRDLMQLFLRQAASAFDNLMLTQQLEETQREIVYRLGEAVESRSQETGNHVKRVAEISRLLAHKYGMDPKECEVVFYASPLHDVGKIAIPDAILNKPGKLTDEEWEVMKTHAQKGHDILCNSDRPILKAAALIARDHHEKWDGSGYPAGRKGDEIDILGRITAIADVFDALGSDRCYKKAWPLEEVLEFFRRERGRHFDPRLVDILFDSIGEITAIRDRYQD